MTPQEKEQLRKAVMSEMIKNAVRDRFDVDVARKSLHGLTAEELIARQRQRERDAEVKAAELRERLAEQIASEIRDLEKRRRTAEEARAKLKSFKVVASRFYYKESMWSKEPIIELKVTNGTAHPVSHAYFRAVLQSPGRSVPWVSSGFNYSIAGGLEPSEEATWKLSPNMFGEWSRAPRDRTDMVLTVEVVRLDGANGKPLFDATEFTELDRKRLDELRAQQPAAPRK